MEEVKEVLSPEILEKLRNSQSEINLIIMDLGQLGLRNREIRAELVKLDQLKISMETKFDELNQSVNLILSDLEKTYPKGEVDLRDGTIRFEK
jgi:hypothetical protein